MPQYKVLKPGFWNKIYCIPDHPRKGVVITKKAIKPLPSWLELMKPETAVQTAARIKSEEEHAELEGEQAEVDKQSLAAIGVANAGDASFLEENKGSTVETL